MSYQPNGTGIIKWDADSVPLATIALSGTFSWSATGVYYSGTPGVDCAYSQTDIYTISESKSHSATRSTYNHDSPAATDSFYVYRKHDAGVKSFIIDGALIEGTVQFFKDFAVSIHHTVTYARTGPNPGGTCPSLPSNVDEYLDATLTLQITLTQSDNGTAATIEIAGGIGVGSDFVSVPNCDTGTDLVTPRIVTLEDLKYSGSVNIGSTATLTAANPDPSYWTSWSASSTFTLATS